MTKSKKRSEVARHSGGTITKRPPPTASKSAPPPKSAPAAKTAKPGRAEKATPAPAAKSAPASKSSGKSAPVSTSREKLSVKDGGSKTKIADSKAVKGAKGKTGKASSDGKKPVAPPVPPRKIQVVQLTTLKPGARGTKASVARRTAEIVPQNNDDKGQPTAARKRRSAELTRQQLDHFRELLTQRRSRLSSDLSMMQDEALKVTAQDNSSDSVADTGTDNYEQDFTLGLIESEEALAREVDQALVRIEENTFGVCETCQTPIPLARLEILPFARHCVECQQKREVSG